MRIAIIGTSNSLMASGYTHGVAQSTKVTKIENFSMGGSISLLASVTTKGVDFSQFDVCLLDFAVNEPFFLLRGISTDDLYAYERAIAGKLIAAGCLPVILILPRRRMGGRRDIVREHHLRLARDLNLPYFDVTRYLDAFTAAKGIERPLIFKDGGHLARWFAIALGHQIAEGLDKILREGVEFIDQPWAHNQYHAASVSRLVARKAQIIRQNSLFSLRFARLWAGDKIQLDASPGSAACGIWANFASSGAIMRLSGESSRLIDIRNPYQLHGRSLFEVFTALTLGLSEPIVERDGKIDIEIVPLNEIPESEQQAMYGIEPCRPSQPDLGVLELGGLILRGRKTKEVERMPAPRLHVDLASITQPTAIEAAVDIFLSHSVSFSKSRPSIPSE